MKKISLLLFVAFFITQAQAQQNIGLHFMDIWQQNRTNPAYNANHKVNIGLANVYSNTVFQGSILTDALSTVNGKNIFDVNTALQNMEAENSFSQNLSIETLNLGLRFGKVGLSLSHASHVNLDIFYPKALPQLVFQGNSQFIGETIDIAPNTDILSYNEFALGASYHLDKFSIGARIKRLIGVGALQTNQDRKSATLYTDPDIYQLTLTTDYEVLSSNLLSAISLDTFNLDFTPSATDISFSSKNTGIAFDLGAEVNLNKLQIAASILDIGSIEWLENAKSFASKGTYTYDGLVISDLSQEGIDFENDIDTLKQIFKIEETEVTSGFKTTLAPQLYVSGKYKINKNIAVGALYYSRLSDVNKKSAIALNGQFKIKKFLTTGLTYAIIDDQYTNLGLNAALKLGPIQLYALTDNILGIVKPTVNDNINLRFGLNVLIGKVDKMKEEYIEVPGETL